MAEADPTEKGIKLLDLPVELLIKICLFLSNKEKITFALTCRAVKTAVYSKRLWKNKCIYIRLPFNTKGWSKVYTSLEERGVRSLAFTLESYAAFDAHLALMARYWPGVSVLVDFTVDSVQGVPGVSGILEDLQLPKVTRLRLACISVEFVRLLHYLMPSLEFLDVRESQFNDDCAKALVSSSQLRCLRISRTAITNTGVGILCGHSFGNNMYWHDPILPLLENLEVLDIANNMIVSSGCWRYLKMLEKLKILVISESFCAAIDDYNDLAQIVSLGGLVVRRSIWPEKILFNLSRVESRLNCLYLNSCDLTDAALNYLIRGFDEVVYLRLSSKIITDKGVDILCDNMPQLIYLDLKGCVLLTDRSLTYIAERLKKLRYLRLLGCNNLTAAQIANIPKKCCVQSNLGISKACIDLPENHCNFIRFCYNYLNFKTL